MTYRIYGDPISGNCDKVRWTADRLGVPYRWIETSVLKKETRTDEFLALNPVGQVPLVVTPEGKAIGQSNAIILFLNERHDGDLAPDDVTDRAKMYEWLFWEQYNHEPYIAVRRFHKRFMKKSDDELDPKLMTRGNEALALMDATLARSDFFVGGRLSLADIALVAYTRLAGDGGFDLPFFANVSRWIDDVERALGMAR